MAGAGHDNTDDCPVHLGFCEPIDSIEYVGHRSPKWSEWDGGQVGGRPSWLNPCQLPLAPLQCTQCNTPPPLLRFVCQLYAPLDSHPAAFHRSLYVFACPSCNQIRVLRGQLPRENSHYPLEGNDNDNDATTTLPKEMKLCVVCGQRAKGTCPIQKQSFCGKQHQKEYKQYVLEKSSSSSLPSVYPMYELVVEEEPEASLLQEPQNRETLFEESHDGNDSDEDLEQHDLNAMTGSLNNNTTDDAVTTAFMERIERAKTQCVRYHQWKSLPLWIRSDHVPDTIPDCPYCGAPRKFEFQLMPQLLHYLKQHANTATTNGISQTQKDALLAASAIVEKTTPEQIPREFKETHDKALERVQKNLMQTNELDWGVVAVYTCTASCDDNDCDGELGAYREEYAWTQPSL